MYSINIYDIIGKEGRARKKRTIIINNTNNNQIKNFVFKKN